MLVASMRAGGARVGIGELLAAHRALRGLDPTNDETAYLALRASLCSRDDDIAPFDAAFAEWFATPTLLQDKDFAEYSEAERRAAAGGDAAPRRRRTGTAEPAYSSCPSPRAPAPRRPSRTCAARSAPRCAPAATRSSATGAKPAIAPARWCSSATSRARWSRTRACCSSTRRPAWPHGGPRRPSCSALVSLGSPPSSAAAILTAPSSARPVPRRIHRAPRAWARRWACSTASTAGGSAAARSWCCFRTIGIGTIRSSCQSRWPGSRAATDALVWLDPLSIGMQAALPHVDHFLAGNSLASLQELARLMDDGLE